MDNSYAEFLVKRRTPASAHLVNAMMVILSLISLFLAFTFNGFAIILFCAVSFCTYLIFRNSRVEFEYLFIDGQLSVDQILGQAKRRTVCNIDMANVQLVAPSGSPELDRIRGGQARTVDYSSQTPHAATYTILVNTGSARREVIFEPDERMLDCMCRAYPKKVVRNCSL